MINKQYRSYLLKLTFNNIRKNKLLGCLATYNPMPHHDINYACREVMKKG